MRELLYGIVVAESLVAALFFVRFWRQSKDRLFRYFAAAFAILAANWFLLAFVPAQNEARTAIFVLRLVAFVLIIVAIVDKNRSNR
jgi:hypothetical protein